MQIYVSNLFQGPRKIHKMMQIYVSNLQDSYNLRVAGGFNGNLRTEVCTVPYMYDHILWGITAFFPSPPDCVHKINALWGFPERVSTVCV